jgi:hypothetical protein
LLDAVIRPEARFVRLRWVVRVDDGAEVDEGLLAWVVRSEGDVVRRVPVFGADPEDEGG